MMISEKPKFALLYHLHYEKANINTLPATRINLAKTYRSALYVFDRIYAFILGNAMPVITSDILLEDVRRDDLFEWLGDLRNHAGFLKSAFSSAELNNENTYLLQLHTAMKTIPIAYTLEKKDGEYGGRRIRIKTTGKRCNGQLNFSLRTMKPSRNTMLTITWDYSPGTMLGLVLNRSFLEKSYFQSITTILKYIETNKACIPTTK